MPPSAGGLLARCRFPPPGEELDCGVSGGADSLALLILAVAAGCRVTAIHVDHGLRPGSEAEAEVVRRAAEGLGAAFRAVSVEVGGGPNVEARARRARLSALPPDAATGHTADDQAETVVLNLLRGAGLDGLAGMRPGRRHPILALRRAETVALCADAGLRPVDDPSNRDLSLRRNRVRHQVMPLLAQVGGRDVAAVVARQAALLADDADLLDSLASAIDPTVVADLAAAPAPLARRALRRWLRDDEGHPPSSAAVERVMGVVRHESTSAEIGGGRSVHRRAGRLRLERD
ncbi:MAG TPA: tRNA lysidine(34) synthetase TilS [Acidimicrobiales bacterium]|nr:tRNA lysidine(34) synthetase TilS [Acidimicrobiales bacterium]